MGERLGRVVAALLDDPEALGLLALMLLHEARRATRVDATGDVVLLEDQDRALWDRASIAEVQALIVRAVAIAMRDGPEVGLATLEAVFEQGGLDGYSLAHAARADLLRRLGRSSAAAVSYARALELTRQPAERRFLAARLRGLPPLRS